MMGFIQSKAAVGDPEAIQAKVVSYSIGGLDKPKKEEPKIWELFAEVGMFPGVPKRLWAQMHKEYLATRAEVS